MGDETIGEVVAEKIGELDSEDTVFLTLILSVIGLMGVPVIAYTALTTAPYATLGFFAVSVVGGLTWRLIGTLETESPEPDPVTTLENRLAAGEITHEEFEQRLDEMIDAERRAEEADLDHEELELTR